MEYFTPVWRSSGAVVLGILDKIKKSLYGHVNLRLPHESIVVFF